MENYRVLFDSMDWQSPAPGLRFKAFRNGHKQIRLLEHLQEFVERDWCEKGHAGLVLKGDLEVDFQGNKVLFHEGDGIFIPAGEKHKGRPVTPSVLLFLVEEI
jgi:hypothetical protein